MIGNIIKLRRTVETIAILTPNGKTYEETYHLARDIANATLEDIRKMGVDVLPVLEPCHYLKMTQIHEQHSSDAICNGQKESAFIAWLHGLGFNIADLPRRAHKDCFFCRRDPSFALKNVEAR